MTYENVDIYFKDKRTQTNPVSGVVVKVMNQAGTLQYGQGISDVNGKASFLLPSDATYQVRFFKAHVLFSNPLYIPVLQFPGINIFDVFCEPFIPPISTDLRLCVASGFFRRPDGSPAPNLDMHFIAKFDPILLEGDAMVTERVSIRTDEKGYAQIPLVRFGQYDVMIEGFEDSNRIISVPDLASINLPDLLFPVVAQISFDLSQPFNVPLGNTLMVTPTVITTDGRILEGTATGDVNWSSSNLNILSIAVGRTQISLTGLTAGSANLLATRGDLTIIRIPDPGITGIPAAALIA